MSSVFSKRILAFIIDFFVVSAIMWIISYYIFSIMNPYDTYKVYPFLIYVVPVLIMIYFICTEKLFDATIGKAILNLQGKTSLFSSISLTGLSQIKHLFILYFLIIPFNIISPFSSFS